MMGRSDSKCRNGGDVRAGGDNTMVSVRASDVVWVVANGRPRRGVRVDEVGGRQVCVALCM